VKIFRRSIQIFFLIFFVLLLFLTTVPLNYWVPRETFFYLDPLLAINAFWGLGTFLLPGFLLTLVLLISTLVLGRFFCSYICPWGSTFEFVGLLGSRKKHKPKPDSNSDFNWRRVKYLLLIVLLCALLYGVNLLHWGAPFSQAGRFFIVILGPFLDFIFKPVFLFAQSLFEFFDLPTAIFVSSTKALRFQGLFFFALFFILLFALTVVTPRFWCRYLCPSGALLSLLGRRALIRRKVNKDCNHCGICISICPMGAIASDPYQTDFEECIVCQKCAQVCPEGAISFGLTQRAKKTSNVLPSRRGFIFSAGLGMAAAFVGTKGLYEYWPDQEKGQITRQGLVRPPGSRPEENFQVVCLRCGLCMRVCPTNMLQPAWEEAGLAGMFSPVAVSRRGPCEPECNACGQVCPSLAIRPLSLREKQWAKMGTAVINRQKCLAWEFDKACLICDEACPYGAIELQRVEGKKNAVPFVLENKCAGCGFCEYSCPVRAKAAIVVTPMAEQRLLSGSYISEGKRIGLDISRKESQEQKNVPVEEDKTDGLPPGFGG
jgi:ferredoxin